MEQQKNSRPAGTGTTERCRNCKKQPKQHGYYITNRAKKQALFYGALCVIALLVTLYSFRKPLPFQELNLKPIIHHVAPGEIGLRSIARQYKPDNISMNHYMDWIYEHNEVGTIFPGDIVTVGVWEE